MTEPTNHADCKQYLDDGMAQRGIETIVSTEPPLVAGPYTRPGFVCPHGTSFWLEPTGEQIAQWAKDGTR